MAAAAGKDRHAPWFRRGKFPWSGKFRKQAPLIELTMTKTGGPASPAAASIGGGSPQLNKARKNRRWPVSEAGGLLW